MMTVKIGETETEKKILFAINEDWLARRREEIIDPGDADHRSAPSSVGSRLALSARRDARGHRHGGHNIRATVYLQCDSMYRAEGDPKFAPRRRDRVRQRRRGDERERHLRAGADLRRHRRLCRSGARRRGREVLEAHMRGRRRALPGRPLLRRVGRRSVVKSTPMDFPKGLLLDGIPRGLRAACAHGLCFDAWIYHPQITELIDLARAFPDTPIVLDHVGAPLGIGPYAGRRDEVFEEWQRNIRELAACPNVHVKLGGMGMHVSASISRSAAAAVLGGARRGMAALCRDLHRGVRHGARDVREQFPGRQALLQLCRPVERVQAARRQTTAPSEKAALFFNAARAPIGCRSQCEFWREYPPIKPPRFAF